MKKRIFAISGSTRSQSANAALIRFIAEITADKYDLVVFEGLSELPHFNPDLDQDNPPAAVIAFRNQIQEADGVLICTPEYVFSLPGSLKNALEWTVSTLVFNNKPSGLITASANGQKGHAELGLVMKTIGAKFTPKTRLLIQGVKGKLDKMGNLSDDETRQGVLDFLTSFDSLLKNK
jgi:NAD(P)H-dependent FMN reductase